MIELIQTLIDQDYAYIGSNGDVYFDVRYDLDYGKLSHRHLEQLKAGARIDINENKRDPLDFVLWKISAAGEPSWPSPWGAGRPGWHIECSAMATDILGQPFDIHGGGLDLKFPHHENEIAQSESAIQKPFANLWMHAGLLEIDKEKMSKSLGNIIPIRDILKKHHPEVLRYFLLSAHYRSPLNYSDDALSQARLGLERLYRGLVGFSELTAIPIDVSLPFTDRFYEAMDDDFNTAVAFSVLFELAREINRLKDDSKMKEAERLAQELKSLGQLLGLFQEFPERFLQGDQSGSNISNIEMLIAARDQARLKKNWAEADRIRDQLRERGIIIEDLPEGTTWRYH